MPKYDEIFDSYKKSHDTKCTKKRFKEVFEELQAEKIKERMLVEELIDSAIKSDSAHAIKILQNSYNVLSVKKGDKLVTDGVIGPKTIKAINGYKNPLELFVWVNMNQFKHLMDTCESKPFIKEWMNGKVINNVKDFFDKKED